MARKHESVKLLREGNSPDKIARLMGISVKSVMGYLYNQVGESAVFRYEIWLSIDKRVRDIVESLFQAGPYESATELSRAVLRKCKEENCECSREELDICLTFGKAAIADMYQLVREIETDLHMAIRKTLEAQLGDDRWWREGIPEGIRVECAAAREKDSTPANDPYSYTTLIHLKDIFDKKWSTLSGTLPVEITKDKKTFLSDLTRLNKIRNTVMHPVRGDRLKDSDFTFVKTLKDSLNFQV